MAKRKTHVKKIKPESSQKNKIKKTKKDVVNKKQTASKSDKEGRFKQIIIWKPHDDKYRTSRWYTGHGEIKQDFKDNSFTVNASYTLTSKVKVENNILDPKNKVLALQYKDLGRCVAVIDETIDGFYGKQFRAYFAHHEIPFHVMVIRAWESDKTPESVHKILAFLGKEGCDVSRNEPVLIVGGGVLSDVGGLACSLQHRRTPYIMIGTSIVAAIDAGPSPRTCVNGKDFKNSIGSYHPPVLTLVDRTFFKTLHTGHIRNGIAEIIKMAITDDYGLFELIEKHGLELIKTHFANVNASKELEKIADEIIYRSLYAYMKHEGTNMFETYQDRPHAYGHTWSPRFEPTAKLMHGHAVSIGMAFGATLSEKFGWVSKEEKERIIALLNNLELSVYHPILEDYDIMIKGQENMRRKRGMGGLWAPLPKGIGSVDYAKEVEPDLLKEAIQNHKSYCKRFKKNGLGKEAFLKDLGLA